MVKRLQEAVPDPEINFSKHIARFLDYDLRRDDFHIHYHGDGFKKEPRQMHVLRSDELDQESRGRMKDGENENQDDQANVPGNADVQHEQETHAAIANGEKAVAGDLKDGPPLGILNGTSLKEARSLNLGPMSIQGVEVAPHSGHADVGGEPPEEDGAQHASLADQVHVAQLVGQVEVVEGEGAIILDVELIA